MGDVWLSIGDRCSRYSPSSLSIIFNTKLIRWKIGHGGFSLIGGGEWAKEGVGGCGI
jgi:hypothetical protein